MRLSRRESIIFACSAAIACVAFVLFLHFSATSDARRDQDKYLEEMRINYNLTEAQLSAIRKIEAKHHGIGGIFFTPSRTHQEKVDHMIALSEEMSPESGARFLADQESKIPSLRKKVH